MVVWLGGGCCNQGPTKKGHEWWLHIWGGVRAGVRVRVRVE